MYYTITNIIGTEITVSDKTFVCGQCYATKTKAPKDVDYLLAFSKAENPVDGLVWRFDGKADIDFDAFKLEHIDKLEFDYDEINLVQDIFEEKLIGYLETLFVLAWKTARIDIQAKIRPSKDSKKAIKTAQRQTDIVDIEARFAAGDIDAAEFGRLAMILASQM
jgi:hypothetical protein